MDKKPSVFPTQEQRDARQLDLDRIAAYEAEKAQVTNEIYKSVQVPNNIEGENYNFLNQNDVLEQMRLRSENEMNIRNSGGVVRYPELAEKTEKRRVEAVEKTVEDIANERTIEQMKLRDEQIKRNNENIEKYQYQANEASARGNANPDTNAGLYPQQPNNNNNNMQNNNYIPPTPPPSTPNNNGYGDSYGKTPSNVDPYIIQLSQPNYNAPFDVIPLPSQGKLYPNKKANVRLAYMTTADENILTSPNLLASGEFLEIFINRKLLEPDMRYKDLHTGDRNAIMIWLRATGYGHMYPVTLLDENNEEFDTDVNLNDLKTKNLGAEPDNEGLFSFQMPLSKVNIKFKLLTCADVDSIERMVELDKGNKIPVDNTTTYSMEKTIVEVNGDRNKSVIKDFVDSMRILDARELNEYIDSIQSGIDLNITVPTPGGGSIATFLPLNFNFFWPNFRV